MSAATQRDAPLVQTPDFRQVISVARTPSSLTVSGVANNTLRITYTVYNLRPDPVSGVLLTTTLKSGVTFQSASPAPDQNGQQLAFSLGSLPPLGSAAAQLTVNLANGTSQIDTGASAFAYWNGIAVQSTGAALTLRTGAIDPTLVQSTLNANLNDAVVTGKAAALGNDPNQIFQFVRDEIGYESYAGALRGARGTMWSMAGNSLDKASLLVALLRASGIPARYVSGTPSLAQQQQLILSMFPPQIQLAGYVAQGATLSAPASDPKLLAEAAAHYWVQFDAGAGFVDADPDFAGAQIGQTFTAAQTTFADVPASLNHKVTVKLNVELYQPGLFGPASSTSTPLTQTFTSAELVGHPLTLGHFPQTQTAGFLFTATTNSYTPYLIVSQNDLNIGDDPIITGQQYQEVLTNFPFGSQILTGVFLELEVTDPTGNTTAYSHTVLDRIGYAARKGQAQATVSLSAGGAPAFTSFDTVTVNVASGRTDPTSTAQLAQRDTALQTNLMQLQTQLAAAPNDPTLQQEVVNVGAQRMATATESLAAGFINISQGLLGENAASSLVKSYFSSPRLTVASSQAIVSGQTGSLSFALDLRKDDIRAIAFPGQDVQAVNAFNSLYGFSESAVEATVLSKLTGPGVTTTLSTAALFMAAKAQNIGVISLTAGTAGQLTAASYSADAKAHISDALQAGKTVIVPQAPVNLNGQLQTAWYEVDPATGVTVDTGEDGNHQGITGWAFFAKQTALVIGIVAALAGLGFASPFAAKVICSSVDDKVTCKASVQGASALVAAVLVFILQTACLALTLFAFRGVAPVAAAGNVVSTCSFVGGATYITSVAAGNAAAGGDPPLDPVLTSSQQPDPVQAPGTFVRPLAQAANRNAGVVQGQVQAASVRATNQIAASWSSTAISGFAIGSLSAANATIRNSSNATVGTGSAGLMAAAPVPAAISGSVNYAVNGNGDLSFYGPATSALGVSGNWNNYSATLTGAPSVQIATNALTLNGTPLPQDTYTITAASITVGGSGQTTSPNFAASASMTSTSGGLFVGPGSGTFTAGGQALSPANGISLDSFNGTLAVTGNGTTDNVNINGTALQVLAVTPSPASLTTNQNAPVTFATTLATSLTDTYLISAEAPPGWSVFMDTSGNVTVTPAAGLQSGTFPVWVTAISQSDPNLAAQAPVMITLSATTPGVNLNVTADSQFSVPVNGAQLQSAFRASIQNTGPAADTFNLSFSNVPAGFTVLDSSTAATIPAGSVATVGIYLTPSGSLPPPNTQLSFKVTATSASNPAITASQNVTFTVPAIQAATLTPNPSALFSTPGTASSTALTVQSTGNVAVSLTLTSTTSAGISLGGLAPSLTLNPGQSSIQNLTITPAANAPLDTPLMAAITAAWGASSTAQAGVSLQLSSTQAGSASAGATAAANLGRADISTTLSGLAVAIDTALSSCSSAAQSQVLAYVDSLIQEMNAPFLASFTANLQSARSAIASATCANIGTALTQLGAVLSNLGGALNSPAAFPFSLSLMPNSALAIPNQAASFLISLSNNSTTTNTYTLGLGTLPAGVTGSLSQNSVTLGPGQAIPVSGAPSNPSVSITPTTPAAVQFSVSASVNGVAGSAQTAYGTLTARSTFLAVEDVKATPGFTNAGGSVDVVTHIANVVNTNQAVNVKLTVLDSSNSTKTTVTMPGVQLSVQTLVTSVDFGQISTTGFPNGTYSLVVNVIDPATNQTLPGGTGTGTLLVGSPVTATLTATPPTLAPGNATVTSTLTVSTTGGGGTGGAPFSLLGSVATASQAVSVAPNGNTVYTCDANEVSVINAADPTHPTLTGTAFAGAIVNASNIYCDIQRGDLVMLADANSTLVGNNPSFLAFDLTNPAAPSLIKSTPVFKRFFGTPYYLGNTAFFGTNVIFTFGSFISDQGGDFVSLDVTDFSNPTVLGTVEQPQTKGPTYGGSFNVYGTTPYNTQIAYAGSTTSTGSPNGTGTGQLWAINTSNPSSMSVLAQVNVPGTVQLTAPLVQGNTAVAIGDTGGWKNPLGGSTPFAGTVVVAVFDLTNPQNPQLVANVPTSFLPEGTFGRGAQVIGQNLFLYAGVSDASNNHLLMTVDTTDPHNPVIKTYQVPHSILVMKAVGALLYAPNDSGLDIYSIPGTGAIQYTAAVQIAKNATVSYNANSFSVFPTSTTPGAGFDTVSWVNPPSNVITWTSNVTGIQAGQVLPIELGATVNFTVPAGSGSITVPQADVNADQIIGLNPSTQTVGPGKAAAYTVTLKNPTASQVTYNLAATGVSPNWVTLQSSVTVGAASQVQVPLTLQSESGAAVATYGFTVTATSGGASGSVEGTLVLTGPGGNIGTVTAATALGVSATLIPVSAPGGQATPAKFIVQLTNTGNVSDTYTLSLTAPGSVSGSFGQTSIQVPPGLGNFRQVLMTLTAAQGTPAGPVAFSVTATSQTSTSVTGTAPGTLNVVGNGVKVSINPPVSPPGGTFQVTVTNTGNVSDTFDLVLGGAAGVAAALAQTSVTLGPGASQVVNVNVGQVQAPPGNVPLLAMATSRANTSVAAAAQATVAVPSSTGVTAVFSPSQQGLAAPGPATFLLNVQNTGNVQDNYSVTITGTTGPVTASLEDVGGNAVQAVPVVQLPGLAAGQLVLNTTLTGSGTATVIVKVTSNSNPAISSTATATLQTGTVTVAVPVANAGKNRNVPTGKYSLLDGSRSYDPGGARLSFVWSLVSKPPSSQLTAPTPIGGVRPVFLADVDGAYTFQLVVSNATQTSSPSTVTFTAFTGNVPPNADAGKPHNGVVGKSVTLDGSTSFDPDQGPKPLTYVWTVAQAPSGSAVTTAGIVNPTQAVAGFTPDVAGTYVMSLTVNDGAASNSDTVAITVNATDAPPNAIAGPDRRVLPGTLVALDGSASSDPDGQAISYQWQFAAGALNNTAITNPTAAKASFTPALIGYYVGRLTVNDGQTGADNVTTLATGACDANGDGLVNQIDADLMSQINGSTALPGDPLDVDGNGIINAADIAICQAPPPPPQLPSISVDKTTIEFDYVSGDPAPPAQTIQLTGSQPNLQFQVSTNGTPWLMVNPLSGATNATLSLTIDPTKVRIGNTSTFLTVFGTHTNPGQINVTVVLHVLEPARLTLIPGILTFQWQQGAKLPPAQTVTVGSVTRNQAFTATTSAAWIQVTPASGQTLAAEQVSVVGIEKFAAGKYQGTATFTATNGPPQNVQVNLFVLPSPPVITLAGVTNAASGQAGAIAAGEELNVTGQYFGPAQLVKNQPAGVYSTSLADTTVLFEGVPAPMLEVVNGRAKVVAPFSLDGRTTATMQVVSQGIVSNSVVLAVAKSAPGVFTADGSGQGQALAMNADGTANSTSNAAARGTKVKLYITGGGQLNPPGFDGKVASAPLAMLAQAVTVQIGGQAADVSTAGDADGQVEGYVEVDVTVPQGIQPGNAPVVVSIAGNQSQAGVTLAVK